MGIRYNIEKNSELDIMDGLGRIISSYLLTPENVSITFNISDLENGFYFYRIINSEKQVYDEGQFVISK